MKKRFTEHDFKNKRITVFGLGLHGGGVDTVRFLVSRGARVIVTDIKPRRQLETSLEKLRDLKNVEFVLGQHRSEDFTRVDMVIKTPPVPWNNKHILLARRAKVPVRMDADLFFELCPCPIIGVTGTKGKTTTALLIEHILRQADVPVVPVGIGQVPVLGQLEKIVKNSVAVFELSSWRLSSLPGVGLSPQVAVLTNLLDDHGDYYRRRADYEADKKNIIAFQKKGDWAVLNADDPTIAAWADEAKGRVLFYSVVSTPAAPAVFVKEGRIYFNDGEKVSELMKISDLPLRGKHNLSNVLAAVSAVICGGVDVMKISPAIASFAGAPHRLETVAIIDGVSYINDTTATIPEATLSSIKACGTPTILIAGGTDKNLNFDKLAQTIVKKVKKLILLPGSATDKLVFSLRRADEFFRFQTVNDLNEALEAAFEAAERGDTVLFSPASASFGLFANEFERGDRFRQAVKRLEEGLAKKDDI